MVDPEQEKLPSTVPLPVSEARNPTVPLSIRMGSLLAWVEILICLILASHATSLRSVLCSSRSGCESVLNSSFAELRGIPLPWLGLAFHGVLLGIWLTVHASRSPRVRALLLEFAVWMAVIAVTFSTGLMYVQFGVLQAFCPLCTASALVVAGSLVVAWRARQVVDAGGAGASRAEAVTIALFAIFPLAIFLSADLAGGKTPDQIALIDLATAHRMGPPDAPVQLIVFSDFQCGYCRQLAPVLSRVREKYPQEVTVVYQHYPLDIHPRAFAAAVASECAAEQGAFWPYHDKLFAEGGNLEEPQLVALAASLKLDEARFTAGLRGDRPRQIVESNMRAAEQLGLPGVPVVFLNGELVKGVPAYEYLVHRIDDSLRKRTRSSPEPK